MKRISTQCSLERGTAHHWLIAEPSDGKPFKLGRCKFCRQEKAFRVAFPEHMLSRLRAVERRAAEKELLDDAL